MPEVRQLLEFLELIERNQPVHAYGLAVVLGNPLHVTLTWKWLKYLLELEILLKVEDDGRRTSRKMYTLTSRGVRLLAALKETWGDKRSLTVQQFTWKKGQQPKKVAK